MIKKVLGSLMTASMSAFFKSGSALKELERLRLQHAAQKRDELLGKIRNPNNEVLSGPFKGMEMPSLKSLGSSHFARMLGCYEKELHPYIRGLSSTEIDLGIDIGAAEGYYAVGLALMFPEATIVAADTNTKTHKVIKEAAKANGVSDRISLVTEMDSQLLSTYQPQKKGLIVCDCEGAEYEILQSPFLEKAQQFHFIIETHNYHKAGVHEELERRLTSTHELQSIDPEERSSGDFPCDVPGSTFAKLFAMREWRFEGNAWLLADPKVKN